MSNSNEMSHQHFDDHRHQIRDLSSFHRAPEEQQQYQSRNGMKRPRDYSPTTFDYESDPSCRHQVAKRLRRLSGNDSMGMTIGNFNNINSHGELLFTSKSDDEISLAEEAQTAPTALPHHSSFMQHKQKKIFQQPTQIHQHQQPRLGPASVTATSVPSGNTCSRASGTTYATDYQPINSMLGNLHLMRQQQQRKRQSSVQIPPELLQSQDYSAIVPHQQQPQNHYHRHYGNYHSVPATYSNAVASRNNHSRRNTVSLRVSSNLH